MRWQNTKLQAKADLLKEIRAIEPYLRLRADAAQVDTLETPFYPGGLLIRCRTPSVRADGDNLWYVKLHDLDIVALDGSVANIHYLNFHAPLVLTPDTLALYLKFRLYFGKENGNRRYLAVDKPLKIETLAGNFICTCQFYEEGKLYAARFKITSQGELEMIEKKSQSGSSSSLPAIEFAL